MAQRLPQNAGGSPWVVPQTGFPTTFFLRFIEALAQAVPLPVTTTAFSVAPVATAEAALGDALLEQVARLSAQVEALQAAFVQLQQDLAQAGVLKLR